MNVKKKYIEEMLGSFFLLGPRGIGKSTWTSMNMENTLVLDLLDPEIHRRFLARPEMLSE